MDSPHDSKIEYTGDEFGIRVQTDSFSGRKKCRDPVVKVGEKVEGKLIYYKILKIKS